MGEGFGERGARHGAGRLADLQATGPRGSPRGVVFPASFLRDFWVALFWFSVVSGVALRFTLGSFL